MAHDHDHSKTVSLKEIEAPTWPETCKDEVEAIIRRYPEGQERSAILPLLHLSMREREGHFVAVSDMAAIAEICGVSVAYVNSVCSFYAMYHRHPIGKYLITVCGNMCCHLIGGGNKLVEHIEKTYGIKNGETTPDGLITLEVTGECLAACDLAPVIHVNTEYAVKMTPAKFDGLVEALRSGKGPDAFLEKLPLMNGENQDEWKGFQNPAPAPAPATDAPAPDAPAEEK
ncbi:MAG TPA: NAD(P)H-dependent oxidoreductase subunit E [Symbiobacteriaceae bacterium]|jgi:NADH-quinone oxidoreductase subunit E|nr:NAD(P)H-dependent oxidoreductase subunit E [Symbiobacteriaceae bacterium]